MKRSRLQRRTRLKAKKALARGTARLKRGKALKKRKRLKANRERLARLERENYGPEAVWIRGEPCEVTGAPPAPSVAAHPKTRGAGGTSKDLVPFHPLVEIDWHSLDEAKWEEKYGRSKEDVRDAAPRYYARWCAMLGDGRAAPYVARWEDETGLVWEDSPGTGKEPSE